MAQVEIYQRNSHYPWPRLLIRCWFGLLSVTLLFSHRALTMLAAKLNHSFLNCDDIAIVAEPITLSASPAVSPSPFHSYFLFLPGFCFFALCQPMGNHQARARCVIPLLHILGICLPVLSRDLFSNLFQEGNFPRNRCHLFL